MKKNVFKLLAFLQADIWLKGFPILIFVIMALGEGKLYWLGGIAAVLWVLTLSVQHIKIK